MASTDGFLAFSEIKQPKYQEIFSRDTLLYHFFLIPQHYIKSHVLKTAESMCLSNLSAAECCGRAQTKRMKRMHSASRCVKMVSRGVVSGHRPHRSYGGSESRGYRAGESHSQKRGKRRCAGCQEVPRSSLCSWSRPLSSDYTSILFCSNSCNALFIYLIN